MTEQELCDAIEARLRRNFDDELEPQIDQRLDNEREEQRLRSRSEGESDE
jgi:hypothetical protein